LHLLSEPLRAFQRGKRSKLRVLTRDREQALSAVQLGEAHLAVTVIDDIPPNVISRRIAKVGAAIVMPSNHPLASKRSIAIRDLRDEPLIAIERTVGFYRRRPRLVGRGPSLRKSNRSK